MKPFDIKIYRAFAALALRSLDLTWKAAGSKLGVSDSSLRRDVKALGVDVVDVSTIEDIRIALKGLNFDTKGVREERLPGVIHNSSISLGERFLKLGGSIANTPSSVLGKEPEQVEEEAVEENAAEEAAPVEEDVEEDAPVAAPVPNIQYLLTEHALVVIRDGKPLQVDRDHRNFDKIREALKEGRNDLVFDLIDMRTALTKYTHLGVEVTPEGVTFGGMKLDGRLANRLMDALANSDEEALARLSKFHVKCQANPSFRVVSRIFDFMTANDIEIDEDGDILAFKVVRSNFFDKHSNTMDNSPGKVVSMPRNMVQDDDRITCSNGLHACSKGYIKSFGATGDKLVQVKIDPVDVVSIPTDYSDQKMRCCKYLVTKELRTL